MDERFDSEGLARWKMKVKVGEKLGKGYKLASVGTLAWRAMTTKSPSPPLKPTRSVVTYRAVEKAGPQPPKPDLVAPLATVRRVRLR